MKKTIFLLSLSLLTLNLNSCKKKTKETKTTKEYRVDQNKTEINWTAFKTTDKVAVKGKFTNLNIINSTPNNSIVKTLEGLEFSVPVSSIFSDNSERDSKLKTFFFGAMKNTSILSGTIHISDETSGHVNLYMNGILEKLPFSYTSNGTFVAIEAIMNTDKWKAQTAFESINKACSELHKGADGVSKTWKDVAININVYFKQI